MSWINERAIKNLEANDKQQYIDGMELLIKLLDNIIRNPDVPKYRSIRIGNPALKKLFNLRGIRYVLTNIGFHEFNKQLTLAQHVTGSPLQAYRDYIAEQLGNVKKSIESKSEVRPVPIPTASNNSNLKLNKLPIIHVGKPYRQRINFPSVIESGNSFLSFLETQSDYVMQYEDGKLLESGRNLIPIGQLEVVATIKLSTLPDNPPDDSKEPSFRDLLLVELTNWFNTEFFTWFNGVDCKVCGRDKITNQGREYSNGCLVETYTCCNQTHKFPRYNDVAELLTTRSGRCGEYANCFTFFCRCMDYDARLVWATFDHVWTEVYSDEQHRWIHIDPSDNVVDSPLMYQHGWKRPIDYVIGFSKDDVQDVTWRYVNDFNETLARRSKCSEKELLKTISLIRKKRQLGMGVSDESRKMLSKRNIFEIVELLKVRQPTDNERKGRSSGSLSWKQSRGETTANFNTFTFSVPAESKSTRQFNLRYSCSLDQYELFVRKPTGDICVMKTIPGWATCVFRSENVFRKNERDWKMVYLARNEDTDTASLTWKFDFSGDNFTIKKIEIKFAIQTYENGKVEYYLKNNAGKQIDISSANGLVGESSFEICALLSGGIGENAWQHTQLFRQKERSDEFPFSVQISF